MSVGKSRHMRSSLLCIVSMILLIGCQTVPVDLTVNPQNRHSSEEVLFKARIERGQWTVPGTGDPSVVIGGVRHPMVQDDSGEWRLRYPISCVTTLDYRIRSRGTHWLIPPLLWPSEEAYDPETGVNTLAIQGGIQTVLTPSTELGIFCEFGSPTCTRIVEIRNVDPGSDLIISNITIGPINCPPHGCTGNGTGAGYSIVGGNPPLPLTLGCSEKLELPVRATRAGGYTIQLGTLSIETTRDGFPRTFQVVLNGQVFPPFP